MEKRIVQVFVFIFLIILTGSTAFASSTTDQIITTQIDAINEISITGNPQALLISDFTPGIEWMYKNDTNTSYAITTNETDRKITCEIDEDMSTNTNLKVTLAAPTGWSRSLQVALSTTPASLATGGPIAQSGLLITWLFEANTDAGIITESQRTATFTITSQ
jgi:hypothetical protein